MKFLLPSILSNLVVILLLALLNNFCFVLYAKLRNKYLEKKALLQELRDEVENSHDLIRQQKEVIDNLRNEKKQTQAVEFQNS